MPNTIFSNVQPLRRSNLLAEEICGEYVIYDKTTNKAHRLNPALSWIWQRCDGTNAIHLLATQFQQDFQADSGKEVVLDGLRQLELCGLLDPTVPIPLSEPVKIDRRAILAGTVIWPTVISVLAPTAAAAKSKEDKNPKDKKPKK
jgi:hypothetical protein